MAGPGLLDVTIWRQAASLTVHLVNLTNPMMLKGPARELIAVGAQKVRISLPMGISPQKVRLLVAGTTPACRQSGGWLEVEVPPFEVHEVVAVDV